MWEWCEGVRVVWEWCGGRVRVVWGSESKSGVREWCGGLE